MDSFPIFSLVLMGLGLLVALVGAIAVLIAAFRESVIWGLVVFFVPCGGLIYTCAHWAEAKLGFLLNLGGIAVCVGAVMTLPDAKTALEKNGLAKYEFFSGLIEGKEAATGKPEDLKAQIEEKRKHLSELQGPFMALAQELPPVFKELEKRRATLRADDDAAINKFNQDAAAYQAKNKQHHEMQQEMATTQAALDALVQKQSGGKAPAGTVANK
jgi:hypothetical protein